MANFMQLANVRFLDSISQIASGFSHLQQEKSMSLSVEAMYMIELKVGFKKFFLFFLFF